MTKNRKEKTQIVTSPVRFERKFAENPDFTLKDATVRFDLAQAGDIVAFALPFHHQDRPWQVDFLRMGADREIDRVSLADLDRRTASRVAPAALELLTSAEVWTLLDEASSLTGRDQSEHLAVVCPEAMLIVPLDEADYEDWSSDPAHAFGDRRPEWINMLHIFEPPSNHAALQAMPQIGALLDWHNRRIAVHLDPEHAVAFRFDHAIFNTKAFSE